MRFLTAYLANKPGNWHITGSERMKQRPIGILVEALKTLGAEITYPEREGFPPLSIKGKAIEGGDLQLDGSVSSQFISALLMIAPTLKKGLNLLGPPLENNPEMPPSSRDEGLRLLHGLETNLATSLQTPQEA